MDSTGTHTHKINDTHNKITRCAKSNWYFDMSAAHPGDFITLKNTRVTCLPVMLHVLWLLSKWNCLLA